MGMSTDFDEKSERDPGLFTSLFHNKWPPFTGRHHAKWYAKRTTMPTISLDIGNRMGYMVSFGNVSKHFMIDLF